MKVFKFGGASVKNAEAVQNVAQIIKKYDNTHLVVVVSAMGKTTNLLETLARAYFDKKNEKWDIFKEFKNYHLEIINRLFADTGASEEINNLFLELEFRLRKNPSLEYDYEYDQIVCFGELVSTQIISDYLNKTGIRNQWIDVRNCIRTDDNFRDAGIDWEWTEELAREIFDFTKEKLYITQGFIGSTPLNLTTTLGREGSDYTAAIIGSVLNVENVSIWKDVPGVLSADPKKMSGAIKLDEISYREAVEMTHSGA